MSRRKRTERWEDEYGTWEETIETDYDYDRRPRLRRNKIDGILGAGTRAAVRQVQIELGLPADAWPTKALLDRL